MSFWPFGRDPANIELVSRVVTGATQNGYRLRGKLTLHFLDPQRQSDADLAADRCSAMAVALLRESPDHSRIIGAEGQISAELTARYPGDIAPVRAVEVAALHVVGDPALSDELRRASIAPMAAPLTSRPPNPSAPPAGGVPSSVRMMPSMAPPPMPSMPPSSVRMTPSMAPPPMPSMPPSSVRITQSMAPPSMTPPSMPPPSMRRRGSSQMRSLHSLLMPPGTGPSAMGQFVAPHAKDSAARMLIGFLRAHDLIGVRGASIDENSAEMLASLVPVSDAPPGGYEASRSSEIARWQTTLGQGVVMALQHEARLASIYLTRDALARAEVVPALIDAVLEALCAAAFPDELGLLAELGGLPSPMPVAFVGSLSETFIRIAGLEDDPVAVAAALSPLVYTVQDDLNVTAMIIKQSTI